MLNLKAKNKNEEIVLEHLKNNASDTLKEKINKGKKTLEGCWNYIVSEARKQAVNNCACIDDATVFGWAIHYFEEDSIKEGIIPKENAKVTTTQKVEEKAKVNKKQKEEIKEQQLSIFDLMGDLC